MTKAPAQGGSSVDRPRDLIGYGAHPPDIRWPGGAGLAVNFVLNVEEGSHNSAALLAQRCATAVAAAISTA